MSYELFAELSGGDIEARDRAAREMAVTLARNIETLMSELRDILAEGSSMHHVPSFWISPLYKAERLLAQSVAQAAKAAGLVEYE